MGCQAPISLSYWRDTTRKWISKPWTWVWPIIWSKERLMAPTRSSDRSGTPSDARKVCCNSKLFWKNWPRKKKTYEACLTNFWRRYFGFHTTKKVPWCEWEAAAKYLGILSRRWSGQLQKICGECIEDYRKAALENSVFTKRDCGPERWHVHLHWSCWQALHLRGQECATSRDKRYYCQARNGSSNSDARAPRLSRIVSLGLAHEIGTPLGVIQGRAELVALASAEGFERRNAEIITQQIYSLHTHSLLALTWQGTARAAICGSRSLFKTCRLCLLTNSRNIRLSFNVNCLQMSTTVVAKPITSTGLAEFTCECHSRHWGCAKNCRHTPTFH